jgi:hypothetical protein
MKNYIKNNLFYSIMLLGVFFVLAVASGEEETEKEVVEKLETEEAIQISSTQIYKDYDDNEVAADNKYKDKVVEVKGKIIDISKDFSDDIVIKLNGLINNEYEIVGVRCTFSKSHNSEAASLSKGQIITIRGKCDGKLMGPDISGCSLVKSE